MLWKVANMLWWTINWFKADNIASRQKMDLLADSRQHYQKIADHGYCCSQNLYIHKWEVEGYGLWYMYIVSFSADEHTCYSWCREHNLRALNFLVSGNNWTNSIFANDCSILIYYSNNTLHHQINNHIGPF